VTEPAHAVFLSYASQDAEAAQKICEALRAGGIEVWFDQSELRGGDAWDQKIRREIHDCALFIPVISHHTQERLEGYFRREWKLAIERTHDMAEQKPFLVPVVVDSTGDRDAIVPDLFRAVQWTRLPAGETPGVFVDRIKRLLSPETSTTIRGLSGEQSGAVGALRAPAQASWSRKRGLLVAVAVVVLVAMAYFAVDKVWILKPSVSSPTVAAGASRVVFTPPPHSIAVLPFMNMSGEKDQEYFSEGLTEELLNSLTEINELQVAGRTSAFSFQGKDIDLGTVARKLNVGAILEGSVRRSGHTVRITAQLTNTVTGFQMWSKTYDRQLGDVLQLETEIANAVAKSLEVTLLGDISAKIELGGTRNPAAFDAYLRGLKAFQSNREAKDLTTAIAPYTEAIRVDPKYALAFAGRSIALTAYTQEVATGTAGREGFKKAEADAREAIALAPDLAQAHLALAKVSEQGTFDFEQAREAYERALALAPGNAQVLRESGQFAARMGYFDAGIASLRRAVALDPLSRNSRSLLGRALYAARRYGEAAADFAASISLNPDFKAAYAQRGFAFYELGNLQSARASCESKRDYWGSQQCLAVVYEKLGRHADAEAELAKLKASMGDVDAYQYATIYAQWGNRAKALDWLDTAMRLRDPGLVLLKTDPLFDPLRKEARFRAIERELKFPD
jgi:TolB-like protein/Flp pilus assembly protein TadD